MTAGAALVWSAIAEPDDAQARWLVALLGHAGALAWIREAARDPVGATVALAAHPGDVDRAIAALGRWTPRLAAATPERLVELATRAGARVLTAGDPGWPAAVDDLGAEAPHALWVRGEADLDLVWRRSVAVVGARAATAYGEHVATEIAAVAADRGVTVVSGGAYGIDVAAHRGALAAGGITVAVLAGGVDHLYPAGNAALLARVIATGAVVSEQPPGFAPHRQRFLSRNRLIATAGATIVVEAAHRSGALSTARHAGALARTVGAVPGPVTSASSAGCLRLIRDHEAEIVVSAADALELVTPVGEAPEEQIPEPDGPEFASRAERQAYGAIPTRGAPVSAIAIAAGLTDKEAKQALASLAGRGLARASRGLWARSEGAANA
ncbi:DNA-processing protein DprA [Demequina phytophila]|uniref:DNA-processing protein DprA n=1 Tax=Demequina phytophila TaxID=1638981 RepID=UPI0007824108|nr:DNA-processing protein DprA [Demequina phytophila]